MRFGKKLLSAAAAGALLVTALTGCGGGQGSSPEPSVTLPDGLTYIGENAFAGTAVRIEPAPVSHILLVLAAACAGIVFLRRILFPEK